MAEADVDAYLLRIAKEIEKYDDIMARLKRWRRLPKDPVEKEEMMQRREDLKAAFIDNKKRCRVAISRLSSRKKQTAKTNELGDYQTRFREMDAEFKTYREEASSESHHDQRSSLFSGARQRPADGFDARYAGNDELLDRATDTHKDTTKQLRNALGELVQADEVADATLVTLEEDRKRLEKVDHRMDEIQGDLALSNQLITRFVKRLYTDKIIILFTCLIVCAIAGIIAYSVIDPDQDTFPVPDDVKPPNPENV